MAESEAAADYGAGAYRDGSSEGAGGYAGGYGDHPVLVRKWWVPDCPYPEQCSKASWSRTSKCQSWNSAEECRALLLKHLRNSNLHWHTPAEEHERLVETVEVLEEEVPWEWYSHGRI